VFSLFSRYLATVSVPATFQWSQQAFHKLDDFLSFCGFLYDRCPSALLIEDLASGVHDKGHALALEHSAKLATRTIQHSTSQVRLFDERQAAAWRVCQQDSSPFRL
jgi:hypothetical protein